MKINTLCYHKRLRSLGIGCIAKIMKSKVKVNFGLEDVLTCNPAEIELIDTSKCATVSFTKMKTSLWPECKDPVNDAIVGNVLKHNVGINWVSIRVVTEEDLIKYPRVLEDSDL